MSICLNISEYINLSFILQRIKHVTYIPFILIYIKR